MKLRRRRGPAAGDAPPPHEPAERLSDNFTYNRALWDDYASRWDDPEFRLEILGWERPGETDDPTMIDVLGDEWGTPEAVARIVDEWIRPNLGPETLVAEIGSGGGRIARHVVDEVATLYCFDSSAEMLAQLRRTLGDRPNLRTFHLTRPALAEELTGTLDFVYAFDVYVHFDLHLLWRYLQEVARVLRPGGVTLVHTSNITAPTGWERFASQPSYRVETHYPMCPELVRTLLRHAGLEPVRESEPDASNFYLARDHLVLAQRR